MENKQHVKHSIKNKARGVENGELGGVFRLSCSYPLRPLAVRLAAIQNA
jgi:hypothetical protein